MDPLATPTRVAFAGDWHANQRWARKAIAHAHQERADVIVHLGDFGYHFLPSFLDPVTEALRVLQLPLLFVDGNHENFDTLYQYPVDEDTGLRQLTDWIWHLPRGFRWEWDGVRFLALGGAHSIDRKRRTPGESWWFQESVSDADVELAVAGGMADVLISHDCPTGVVIPGIIENEWRWDLEELTSSKVHQLQIRRVVDVVQPLYIWHGHFHVNYRYAADFGYGQVRVAGLDCDEGTRQENVEVVDLDELRVALGERLMR